MGVELKVRGVPKPDAELLKDLAAKNGVSVQEYMRRLIHNHVASVYVTEEVDGLRELVEKQGEVIQSNIEVIARLINEFHQGEE